MLRDQIREQRKQTEFLVGDSLPSVDLIGEDFTHAYIQIVNWNRRSILIDQVIANEATPLFLTIEKLEINGQVEVLPARLQGMLMKSVRIQGWIDRSKPPSVARFHVRAFSAGQAKIPANIPAEIAIISRLVGEEHKALRLTAKATLNTF